MKEKLMQISFGVIRTEISKTNKLIAPLYTVLDGPKAYFISSRRSCSAITAFAPALRRILTSSGTS